MADGPASYTELEQLCGENRVRAQRAEEDNLELRKALRALLDVMPFDAPKLKGIIAQAKAALELRPGKSILQMQIEMLIKDLEEEAQLFVGLRGMGYQSNVAYNLITTKLREILGMK